MRRVFLDSRAAVAMLAAVCLIVQIAGTWSLPLIDRDEPRFAEASREMREQSDYVIPFFNHQPRYDKPPLIYWCQAGSCSLFGENEFAARLPSVMASVLTALTVFGFGARLYGRRTGFRATAAFSLCLQVFIQSHAATADMCMILFVTLAFRAGWELNAVSSSRQRAFWWSIFYLALALGFLAKGPVAWLPIGGVLLWSICTQQTTGNREMKFHFGIPLMLGIIAFWGVPALLRSGGDYFRVGIGKHVIARSFGTLEGHGGHGLIQYLALLPFYFVTIFASFFPWSIFLPGMLWHFKKTENRGAPETYLISGILATFAVFTLVSTKLPHYTLPAFPLLAILFARWLGERKVFAAVSLAMASLELVAALIFAPVAARFFSIPQLACESAALLGPDTQFAAVDFQEPSLVWYFRAHIRGWMQTLAPNEVVEFMQKSGPHCCVLPTALAGEIAPVAPWKTFSSEGFNPANGRRVKLTIWIKEN